MRPLIKILPAVAASLLTITLFASGCSRKSSHVANSQGDAQTNPVVGTAPPAAAVAPPAQLAPVAVSVVQPDGQPNLAELNRVARMWMYRNHRRPANWDDFAANAGVPIPPPPPGKKYELSKSMRVTLVDR